MTDSIAGGVTRDLARRFNPLASGRFLAYGSLAVFIALAIGIAGGWWNAARLASGDAAKHEVPVLRAAVQDANQTIVRQQQVMAESTRLLGQYQDTFAAIAEDTARERQQNHQQMAIIRSQLELALAARPDLGAVRVGDSVLDAWNSANRGRARGAAGTAPAAAEVRPKPDAARAGKPARSKER